MSVVTGHRHRILFCGPSCYFDDSNDAAIASRGLMETLGRLGFAVEVLTGIVFEVGSGSDTLTVDSLTSDSFSGNDSAVVTPASGAADNITITLSGSDNSSLNETVTTTVSGGGVSSSTSGSDTFDLSESDGTNTYTEDDSDSYDDPIGGSGGTTAANAAASGAGSSGASSGDRSSSHRSGTPPGGWESPGLAYLGGFFGNLWDRATYVPSTVWANTGTSDASLAGRIYVTAGTTVGSLVGVSQVSDAFSKHDAIDGHVQSTGERVFKGVTGGVQLACAGVGGAAGMSARAAASEAQVATTALATRSGLQISRHAAVQMADRGITQPMVQAALRKGVRYWDPKNNVINYVLQGGFASGKSLLVGQYPASGVIATAIHATKLNLNRMIPIL